MLCLVLVPGAISSLRPKLAAPQENQTRTEVADGSELNSVTMTTPAAELSAAVAMLTAVSAIG